MKDYIRIKYNKNEIKDKIGNNFSVYNIIMNM